MKSIRAIVFSLNIAALALFSPLVAAVEPGWYGLLGGGVADYSEQELLDVCSAGNIPCEVGNSPGSFRAGIGYKFNPYLSLEGGYLNLGEVDYSVLGFDAVSFHVCTILTCRINNMAIIKRTI